MPDEKVWHGEETTLRNGNPSTLRFTAGIHGCVGGREFSPEEIRLAT